MLSICTVPLPVLATPAMAAGSPVRVTFTSDISSLIMTAVPKLIVVPEAFLASRTFSILPCPAICNVVLGAVIPIEDVLVPASAAIMALTARFKALITVD
ncbi:hypothetical protein D3C73_1099220 [compost metagenome]